MTQKQWLIEHDGAWDILMALTSEIERQHANGVGPDRLHVKKLEELKSIFSNLINNVEWEYDDQGERQRPRERVVISLVEESGEWWSDPYCVIPIGQTVGKQRWAVVEKGSFRPVGLKAYTQKTHAYRRCRQLNATAREAFTDKRGWYPTPALGHETEENLATQDEANEQGKAR